jgi:hypothetical protein
MSILSPALLDTERMLERLPGQPQGQNTWTLSQAPRGTGLSHKQMSLLPPPGAAIHGRDRPDIPVLPPRLFRQHRRFCQSCVPRLWYNLTY